MDELRALIETQRTERAELVSLADELDRDCPSALAVQICEQQRALGLRVEWRATRIDRLLTALDVDALAALL